MSAWGGAMVRGGILTSNKGMPAMEGAFTGRNDTMDFPRNFGEAHRNVKTTIEMLETGNVTEEIVEALPWTKSLNFQYKYKNINPTYQIAESSYLSDKTILEFVIEVPRGSFIKPADMELVLPVRFRDEAGNRIRLDRWIFVNNF